LRVAFSSTITKQCIAPLIQFRTYGRKDSRFLQEYGADDIPDWEYEEDANEETFQYRPKRKQPTRIIPTMEQLFEGIPHARRKFRNVVNFNPDKVWDISETEFSDKEGPYRIITGVFLERPPRISPNVPYYEQQYQQYRWDRDQKFARPLSSFHEVMEAVDGDSGLAADKEMTPEEELRQEDKIDPWDYIKPAPRTTAADAAGDTQSLDRRLDRRLYLILKRDRTEFSWQFPQRERLSNETLRKSSERAVLERLGGKYFRWTFISNAPAAVWSYPYDSQSVQRYEAPRAKVFMHRCLYREPENAPMLKLDNQYVDFRWIMREELVQYFDEDFAKYMYYVLDD